MLEDYIQAKKLGEAAVKAAIKNGESPYLPVLDEAEGYKDALGEAHVGLMELPLSFITGNKEAARNNAFANNFMPLFEEKTEFAAKWANLYDSYREEGIRESIKCYEFMNRYYVEEGNKRVSVSKYGKSDFILADVTRIIPAKNDTKESRVYYEYLDFYKVTGCFYILFSEPGAYARLAELLGQNMEEQWPEELLTDLKSAYYLFRKLYRQTMKTEEESVVSDAFLIYISIFPMKMLFEDSEEQIVKNIRLARQELMTDLAVENIDFLNETPEEKKSTNHIIKLIQKARSYTPQAPLKVGFIYDAGLDESRWIESHETGRLFTEYQIVGKQVNTASYITKNYGGSVEEAIEAALDEKNEIIFTVTPAMITDTIKAAVSHPDVKFLNCSIGEPHPSIRCYHGKIYEAAFLMGVLAADILLRAEPDKNRRTIGYVVHEVQSMSVASLNAFAIGASLIDPEIRIDLKYLGDSDDTEYRKEWEEKNIWLFADIQYSMLPGATGKPGIYKRVGDKDIYIGAPYFGWGKYYSQIVQSVISGAWKVGELMEGTATNYWFGLSTGVVDIVAPNLPYQTKKLLSFLKSAMINGDLDPFSGEVHSDAEMIQGDVEGLGNSIPTELKKMPAGKIITMDWFNDNIDGTMPIYIPHK